MFWSSVGNGNAATAPAAATPFRKSLRFIPRRVARSPSLVLALKPGGQKASNFHGSFWLTTKADGTGFKFHLVGYDAAANTLIPRLWRPNVFDLPGDLYSYSYRMPTTPHAWRLV